MQSKHEVEQGWKFAAEIMGVDVAAQMGQEYVNVVEAAIEQLEKNINQHQYRNLGVAQLQGYMFEEWSAGTFNVDATAADSADRATVLHSTVKDSVDIQTNSGKSYSAKSYTTAKQSVKAQAKFNPETGQASYYGQERLIPTDQLSDAKAIAHQQALRNRSMRTDVSEVYAETEMKLTDVIENDEGIHARRVSRKELEEIACESKKKEFRAEDHGVTPNSTITTKYMLKQAMKAGYTTAVISLAIQLAPEIYKAIDFLIKEGEIDVQQIEKIGIKGISSGAEGFLHGSVSALLMIMCGKGALGEAFIRVNPTVLGAVTALVIQTVKNSILVAAGKMSAQQMGDAMVDMVVTSVGYVIGTHIGGMIGQALGFELPAIGYLLGSLVGTAFCVAYNIGKNKLIALCIDTGFTCFGLVEQNYELPDKVLHEMGIETVPIPQIQIEKTDIARIKTSAAEVVKSKYETIGITILRRGVIGVNRIGYVLA